MKFSSASLAAVFLVASQSSDAFSPAIQSNRALSYASTTELSSTAEQTEEETRKSKKIDRLGYMKNPQYHRLGFKEVRPVVEGQMQEEYVSELVEDLKSNNYKVEKEGVTMYLAKDFGFCWGVERSIALAYEAVEKYPDKKLHITNELIHNPEVNDALTERKINLIEKDTEKGTKDFSPVEDGDVVILPAFGASYEEMGMLDKKVRVDNEIRNERTNQSINQS